MSEFKTENEALDLNIGHFFRMILMNSKMIISILVVFFLIWISYYLTTPRIYKVQSLIQIESPIQNNSLGIESLYFQQSSVISQPEQIRLYKSRTNLIKVIDRLSLDISTDVEDVEISKLDVEGLSPREIRRFDVIPKGAILFLYEDGNLLVGDIKIGQEASNNGITIKIDSIDPNVKESFTVTKKGVDTIIPSLQKSIQAKEVNTRPLYGQFGGLLSISYNTFDQELGKKLIDETNRIFSEVSISNSSAKASQSLEFIDQRMESLEQMLRLNQDSLKEFQSDNSTIDVDLEVKGILDKLSAIDIEYRDLMIEEAKMRGLYTDDNPILQKLTIQKQAIEKERATVVEKIRDLPETKQTYIDLARDLEVTKVLYNNLLERRLEFSLMEASTLGNIRIIDSAYIEGRVSPQLISSFVLFMGFGLVMSIVLSLIRGIYFSPVTNPAEIQDNNINTDTVGIIPLLPKEIDTKTDARSKEAIQSLSLNLRLLADGIEKDSGYIISILGPSSEVGKSFVSREIAFNLSQLGHKVLLLDADFKRGDQHKDIGTERISKSDLEELNLETLKVQENLYFLPRLKDLDNSFLWVDSLEFKNLLQEYTEVFDFIIIDTAPLMSISESSILALLSDLNILVVRHEKTKIREIKFCYDAINQLGREIDGIIYNSYEKPTGYYGYYSYYGNYSYQYYADKYLNDSYEYKEKS